MSIPKVLGRSAGSMIARCLCSRHGAALVVAGALTLAGGTSWFLGQQTVRVTPRPSSGDMGQATYCEYYGHGLFSNTNRVYCLPSGD